MAYPTLAPDVPRPSEGASENQLTREDIKRRMRRYLELVALSKTYVFHSYLTEGFTKWPKAGKPNYPDIDEIRDEALREFNEDDAKAGRPFVTAVLLEATTKDKMLPRPAFFEALARLKGIEVTKDNAKEVHLREFEAAKLYPWESKDT
jgi:hypothetical protein